MPKFELREMHSSYTDHYIRIVRNPSAFPDGPPEEHHQNHLAANQRLASRFTQ
jgi:hypothetical protein